MSKSFQIHFDSQGNVLVNNIQGVDPSNSECVQVTKPYVNAFGEIVDMVMLNNEVDVSNSTKETETI